jgi:hypothetical protein
VTTTEHSRPERSRGSRNRPEDRLVVVHCGEGDPPLTGAALFRVTPASPSREDALAALAASGLSTADARTRVVFSTSAASDVSAASWAATVGFFGRLLDVVVGGRAIAISHPGSHLEPFEVSAVGAMARSLLNSAPDQGDILGASEDVESVRETGPVSPSQVPSVEPVPVEPVPVEPLPVEPVPVEPVPVEVSSVESESASPAEPPVVCVQLGGPHPDIEEVEITPTGLRRLQRARRARVVADEDTFVTMGRLALVAVARHRDGLDRLPGLVAGDETFDPDAKGPGGLDLDSIRRSAYGVRRASRVDDRSAVAEPVPVSERQQLFAATALLDVEKVLELLGVLRTELSRPGTSSVWECPVAVHGDGEDQATLQVVRGAAQCIRCSRNKYDALRLAMWMLDCTADEAADELRPLLHP